MLLELQDVNLTRGELSSKGHHGGVTADVSDISTTIAIGKLVQLVPVDVTLALDASHVDLEELLATRLRWQRDVDSLLKSSTDSLIKILRPISRSQNHDVLGSRLALLLLVGTSAACLGGSVHLDEELGFDLSTSLMITASGTSDGIDLINKDGAWAIEARHLEEKADKFLAFSTPLGGQSGSRNVEERRFALSGNGLGEHGLTCAWWAEEADAFPWASNTLEILWHQNRK